MKRSLWLRLAPYLFTLGFFAVWEIACRAFAISSFILPPPSAIWAALVQYQKPLYTNAFHTLWMTSAGFVLSIVFGLALGLLVGSSRLIYAGLNPLLVGFNSIPKVAVVPILVIWFGVGWQPPVLTAFVISFFPIVVNVATGLATIEPETEDVLKALGASRYDIMTKVGIPRALPYFFGALKVSITLAYVGSVIGEQNASNLGIGNLITRASADFNVPLIFAALIVLAVLGVLLVAIVDLVENRMTGWARRSQLANG
ncbi:ABC-type nitrate/sulfonate/bicarbonate transport system, permease component precursor [Bosea sp. LC85]|uniref:ABC transporter permease n=1 Tax=Bosea sp. LC85 TaxID=1502851 RepID=UPI0004E369F9|nr:ABC transporter permease [Bosea sp. LC85]KFC72192.1 ABC-type nitrate/sulfonate/bicarbonate transport system, permease component precursor [Bosea sp. LC85]